ncbi:hypothetical protein [uncultured Friedmanniella sp.]|uniref:hypothetical protein n=1 Tax=uncultured Friedmanniella sp. TaxID=335381 RepID=UPI0035CA927F
MTNHDVATTVESVRPVRLRPGVPFVSVNRTSESVTVAFDLDAMARRAASFWWSGSRGRRESYRHESFPSRMGRRGTLDGHAV